MRVYLAWSDGDAYSAPTLLGIYATEKLAIMEQCRRDTAYERWKTDRNLPYIETIVDIEEREVIDGK